MGLSLLCFLRQLRKKPLVDRSPKQVRPLFRIPGPHVPKLRSKETNQVQQVFCEEGGASVENVTVSVSSCLPFLSLTWSYQVWFHGWCSVPLSLTPPPSPCHPPALSQPRRGCQGDTEGQRRLWFGQKASGMARLSLQSPRDRAPFSLLAPRAVLASVPLPSA